jgi:hypothetical protein
MKGGDTLDQRGMDGVSDAMHLPANDPAAAQVED